MKGFTDDRGRFRPTDNSGVSEHSIREGKSENVLGTPIRKYSSAVPQSERKATEQKIVGFGKMLNARIKAANASGNSRKDEQKNREKKMIEEANKNLELGARFITNAELLRKGITPPEIKIKTENNKTHETLPKNKTAEEVKAEQKNLESLQKAEAKVIEKIAQTSTNREPKNTIMPEGAPVYQQEPAEETVKPQSQPQPQSSGKKSFDELALEMFPVRG